VLIRHAHLLGRYVNISIFQVFILATLVAAPKLVLAVLVRGAEFKAVKVNLS
jgi:hypothetical protein